MFAENIRMCSVAKPSHHRQPHHKPCHRCCFTIKSKCTKQAPSVFKRNISNCNSSWQNTIYQRNGNIIIGTNTITSGKMMTMMRLRVSDLHVSTYFIH